MALGTWNIDPSDSAIAFSVRHMVVSKTRGRFTKWSGQLRFDEENPVVSSVEVTIDPASVDTADGQRRKPPAAPGSRRLRRARSWPNSIDPRFRSTPTRAR